MANEILNDAQLDQVAGGNINDRAFMMMWIQRHYSTHGGTQAQIIDVSSSDINAIVAGFCARAGVDYQMNAEGLDQFKINGEWHDREWILRNEKEALDFFNAKLGIK